MINQAQDDFFNELYASTNQKVLAYIIVKCGKTEDVADIFQETYTEVVKIIRKHGISYFKQPDALVMQIAKRKIFRHYKLKEKLRGIENFLIRRHTSGRSIHSGMSGNYRTFILTH